MRLLFGEFTPDQPLFLGQGLTVARNTYAGPMGYRPVPGWVPVMEGLPSGVRGAASFISPQGTASIIAGTDKGLYVGRAGTWREIRTG
jgi:hypothetical protein